MLIPIKIDRTVDIQTLAASIILVSMLPFSRRDAPTLRHRPTTASHTLQALSLFIKTGLLADSRVVARLITSISSISTALARAIFDSLSPTPTIIVWNSIIRALGEGSRPLEAFRVFSNLRGTGKIPNKFTYSFVLGSCARSAEMLGGGMVHALSFKTGFNLNVSIGNILLHMYAVCGEIDLARRLFDEMPERDVISWSSMIGAYVTRDCPVDAFEVFQLMKMANVNPNTVSLVSLLSACSQTGRMKSGASIHLYIIVNQIELSVSLGTALLQMYAGCGAIEQSIHIFRSMSEKNLQTWTVMISSLANHGRSKDAISFFTQMEIDGIQPDSVSFCNILSACSHLALVDEGKWYFDRMVNVYHIEPRVEHYGCMVDLFGRAGLVEEAYSVIRNMPMKPNAVILRSFMASCRNYGRFFDMDEDFRKLLLKTEPNDVGNYVLVANISALSEDWDSAAHLRRSMTMKGLTKIAACSKVESDAAHFLSIKIRA